MPKVTGPLLSISARGQIAKSHVFATWKGVKYARQHVIPANPNTDPQKYQRQFFSNCSSMWNYMGTFARATWTAAVVGLPLTARNLLTKINIPLLRYDDQNSGEMISWLSSPGNGGCPATPLVTVVATDGTTITATVTAPALPTGWSFSYAYATAFESRDPHVPATAPVMEEKSAAVISGATADVVFTVADSGIQYSVCGWFAAITDKGKLVYGKGFPVVLNP